MGPPEQARAIRDIAARATAAEVARRCIERGTCYTAWWRSPNKYTPHAFARSIGAECDRWAADFVAGVGSFYSWHAPPGHGKSEHVGRAMPVRALALAPGRSLIYMTSTEDRAQEVSLSVRSACERLAECGAYPHLAPHPDGPWRTTLWRTAGGSWWTAVAPGMSTGGIDGHGLIMDDVTGSADRQASKAWRDRIERFILEDGLERMRGTGPRANMETRRGLDDQTDRLLRSQGGQIQLRNWRHVAELGEQDGRAPGEYLWPERYGAAWHAANPHLGPSSPIWRALHQQEPIAEGGEVIRQEWTDRRYPGRPADMRPAAVRGSVVAFVDPSAKTSQRNDPTGVVVLGRFRRSGETGSSGSLVRVLHAEEVRPDNLALYLRDLASEWRLDGVALEDTSIGPEIARQLRASGVSGVVLQSIAGAGDKVARMTPHLIRWAAGDVELPADAPWVRGLVAQLTSVPAAPHDDLWDALTLGLAYYADVGAEIQIVRRGGLRA